MGAFPYVKMTQDDAKWKHVELRKVRRLGGSGAVVHVPVHYGEAPGAQHGSPTQYPSGGGPMGMYTTYENPVEGWWRFSGEMSRSSGHMMCILCVAYSHRHSPLLWLCVRTRGRTCIPISSEKALHGPRPTSMQDMRERLGILVRVMKTELGVQLNLQHHYVGQSVGNENGMAAGNAMTPEDVAFELGLAANHWAGDHSGCGHGGRTSRCVTEKWGNETAIYEKGSETHKAVQDWLAKRCGPDKVKSFVHGASSSINESFHSVILKYAPKRIRFRGSFEARMALAVLHWNNSMDRLVTAYRTRQRQVTRIRRGNKDRSLTPMDWSWLDGIMESWLKTLSGEADDETGGEPTSPIRPDATESTTSAQEGLDPTTPAPPHEEYLPNNKMPMQTWSALVEAVSQPPLQLQQPPPIPLPSPGHPPPIPLPSPSHPPPIPLPSPSHPPPIPLPSPSHPPPIPLPSPSHPPPIPLPSVELR
ncbi:unnamed protein product [Closterium sp. Yama58-4]|nr:unnamed protein product [Closterium sp. Yama58-4]